MTRWFKSLSRRWRLAIIWIPSAGVIWGLIAWLSFDDPLSAPAGFVAGILVGISSYLFIIRSGGW